uniref:EAL domain-containing protein n=1 Tax=Paenibacillus sp. FSL H8-0548 TaxID=1920422 RepID=UPI0009F939F0
MRLLRIRIKVDTLKIDKSFVQERLTDSVNKSIIQSIISLAKTLEMSVVAEGVETFEQYTFLIEYRL